MVVKRLGGKSYQFALLTWNSKDPASPLLEGELKSNPSNQTVLHVRFRCTLVEMAAGSLLALAIPSILAQLLESQGFNFALMLIVCLPVGYVAFLSLFRLSWKLRQPKMELMLEVLQKHGFVGDEAV